MSRIRQQAERQAVRMARALARGDEAEGWRLLDAGDADSAYEHFERAGMKLDHAEPLPPPAGRRW